MKLQQLRYLAAVVQNGLNITSAAKRLRTSQPAMSKQLRLLEQELGFDVFVRSGRTLAAITAPGEHVVTHALRMLREAQAIKDVGKQLKEQDGGVLSIGTTHTQARYVLPPLIKQFRRQYPGIQLHLHQGTSEQIAELARLQHIDFAIATGSQDLFPQLALLPCYRWHRRIVVPKSHPLARVTKPTLAQIAEYPIVSYVFSFKGPSSLHQQFASAGLSANVVLTARDADVIKTYVRLDFGVGIVADMAVNPQEDPDLVSIDGSHLFPLHTTWLGFQRGSLLRQYMYDFIALVAPHFSRRLVDLISSADEASIQTLLQDLQLPIWPISSSAPVGLAAIA